MKRGVIKITGNGDVNIPDIPVWMTLQETADLFGVSCLDIRKVVRSIYKEGVLSESDTMRYVKVNRRISMDLYSLELVIAVSFRTGSSKSRLFREWILNKLHTAGYTSHCVFIPFRMGKERFRNN